MVTLCSASSTSTICPDLWKSWLLVLSFFLSLWCFLNLDFWLLKFMITLSSPLSVIRKPVYGFLLLCTTNPSIEFAEGCICPPTQHGIMGNWTNSLDEHPTAIFLELGAQPQMCSKPPGVGHFGHLDRLYKKASEEKDSIQGLGRSKA